MRTIEIEVEQNSFFDNQDTDGIDEQATMNRWAELLGDRVRQVYPDAEVICKLAPRGQFVRKVIQVSDDDYEGGCDPDEDAVVENVGYICDLLANEDDHVVLSDGRLLRDVEDCAYCHHATSSNEVPVDEDGWAAAAIEHENDCEWIVTRAHTVFERVGEA